MPYHFSRSRRKVIRNLGALSAAMLLPSLASVRAADSLSQRTTLRIADQKGGIRAQLEASGQLNDLPYKIEWAEFSAAAPLLEALNAGAVDGGYAGDAPLVFALAAGASIKAIAVNRSNPFGTAIIANANSPLLGAASLKGARIATGRGSIGHYVTLAALKSVGLTAQDVSLRFLTPADAKSALSIGAVDAWATWDPYTAVAQVSDNAKIVVNGRGLYPGQSYFIVSQTSIEPLRAAWTDFLTRLDRAQRWSNQHVDVYAHTLAKIIGIPEAAAKLAWERRQSVWLSTITDETVTIQQKTADTYTEAGIIPRRISASGGFDRSFKVNA